MLKLSIITITLNNVDTIEKTITSVLNQNYDNLEYIVIDGGSTDGTLKILNKYKNKFKYFISSPDKGVYDAMNKGVAKSTGDLIGFINGGDYIYNGALSHISKTFSKKKNNFFFTVGDVDYIDKTNQIVGTKFCRSEKKIIEKIYFEMPANHLSIFVPLKAFKIGGLFDLRFRNRADFFFILKLFQKGFKPLKLKKKIGAFRLGGMSGGYSTFFENYKIIRLINGNFLLAMYSAGLGVTKLFFQKNFYLIYKLISKIYYKINKDIQIKESFKEIDAEVIHIIDSDIGGGAEKLTTILEKNFQNTHKILILKKLSEKNKSNPNYFSLNIENQNSFFFTFQATFKLFLFLLKIRNKRKVFLSSHLSKSLYATFIPSVILRMNHIHTEHNVNNRRRSILFLFPFEYLIYSSLKYIICVSEPVKFYLISYLPKINADKIHILKNGINLIKFKKRNFKKKKFNLLILGSLTYKKGIDLFIKAVPNSLDRISQIKIVGSGPEKQKLIDLTKELSLETIIKFRPFTTNIKPYIYRGDIGIVPSRWEGFGLGALEMRSSGMPILISDTPALKNIFSGYNAVYFFKNGSIKSLENKLNYLLDDLGQQQLDVQDLSIKLDVYSEKSFIKRYKKFFSNLDTTK